MKKVLLFLLFCGLLTFIVLFKFYSHDDTYIKPAFLEMLKTTNGTFKISNYYIFGDHFSIEGCIDTRLDGEISLILKNEEEEKILSSNINNEEGTTCFNISNKINNGIYLDDLPIGNYVFFIKREIIEDGEKKTFYYNFLNNTTYSDLEYYTITKNNTNNKIDISFKEYETISYLELSVKKTTLPSDVYDITIDPGHGGIDSGAIGYLNDKEYYESNINLEISLLIQQKLESKGLKVKLTRSDDSYLKPYKDNGRAVIPNSVKSKYCFSIHANSAEIYLGYGGVEVYTPKNVDLSLAQLLSDNLSEIVGYSEAGMYKIDSGIYYKYFSTYDIEEAANAAKEEGVDAYQIAENTPYMFMIREVGGINTGAYVDGRQPKYGLNKYYNSNNTAEPYLIELGYLNYKNDLYKLINNKEDFANSFSKAILEHLNIS